MFWLLICTIFYFLDPILRPIMYVYSNSGKVPPVTKLLRILSVKFWSFRLSSPCGIKSGEKFNEIIFFFYISRLGWFIIWRSPNILELSISSLCFINYVAIKIFSLERNWIKFWKKWNFLIWGSTVCMKDATDLIFYLLNVLDANRPTVLIIISTKNIVVKVEISCIALPVI